MSDWNSSQYRKFEKERTQPSIDLISRIDISPDSILDIGCGPGNSTAELHRRFPKAQLLGIDSSDNMLSRAREAYPGLEFCKCVIPRDMDMLCGYDLIFSNACLHWIPEHEKLLPMLLGKLCDGGMLAVQMPLVHDATFYRCLDRLVESDRWNRLQAVQNFHNLSPGRTYDILSRVSGEIVMWETTYYHTVPSHSEVIEWYKGSGLRPYLERLNPDEREEFLRELLSAIEDSFPLMADGSVILKMPRLFFTARK